MPSVIIFIFHFFDRVFPFSNFSNYYPEIIKPLKNWTIDGGYSVTDTDVFPIRLMKLLYKNEDYGIIFKVFTKNLRQGGNEWIGYKVQSYYIFCLLTGFRTNDRK